MINQTLWDAGLTVQAYFNNSKHFQAELTERARDVRLTPFEKEQLKSLAKPVKVLVLTETWCGDSLMNLPILSKMEEVSPNLTVRVFPRSENEELNQFITEAGYEKIPVFWFMEDNFSLIGVWMERPKAAERLINRWKKANPDFESIKNDPDLDKETKKTKLKPFMDDFIDEAWNWYDTGLQSETTLELFTILGLR